MTKNELLYRDDKIIRTLQVNDNQLLVIDCIRMTMPVWKPLKEFDDVLDSVRYAIYSDFVIGSTERASYDDLLNMFG